MCPKHPGYKIESYCIYRKCHKNSLLCCKCILENSHIDANIFNNNNCSHKYHDNDIIGIVNKEEFI